MITIGVPITAACRVAVPDATSRRSAAAMTSLGWSLTVRTSTPKPAETSSMRPFGIVDACAAASWSPGCTLANRTAA